MPFRSIYVVLLAVTFGKWYSFSTFFCWVRHSIFGFSFIFYFFGFRSGVSMSTCYVTHPFFFIFNESVSNWLLLSWAVSTIFVLTSSLPSFGSHLTTYFGCATTFFERTVNRWISIIRSRIAQIWPPSSPIIVDLIASKRSWNKATHTHTKEANNVLLLFPVGTNTTEVVPIVVLYFLMLLLYHYTFLFFWGGEGGFLFVLFSRSGLPEGDLDIETRSSRETRRLKHSKGINV